MTRAATLSPEMEMAGRAASDYFLVDGNHFHHGLASGANFTSVRRSTIRNNIFGVQVRHNVSFWQETDNPKLGSSDNKILHNLFITTGRQAVQFINYSTRNEFANNVILGVEVAGNNVTGKPVGSSDGGRWHGRRKTSTAQISTSQAHSKGARRVATRSRSLISHRHGSPAGFPLL